MRSYRSAPCSPGTDGTAQEDHPPLDLATTPVRAPSTPLPYQKRSKKAGRLPPTTAKHFFQLFTDSESTRLGPQSSWPRMAHPSTPDQQTQSTWRPVELPKENTGTAGWSQADAGNDHVLRSALKRIKRRAKRTLHTRATNRAPMGQ